MNKKPIVAILYDFDSTLARSDMQNFSFIPSLGMTPDEFWSATSEFSKKTQTERTLSYLYMMTVIAKEKGISMTREWLRNQGKDIKFFQGVEEWFSRVNALGDSLGLKIEHYLISSGNKEIVDGCAIAKEFKEIYACEFLFDEKTGEPLWPKLAINYTQKTQYFFRIAKGAYDANDDQGVNEKSSEKRIAYRNIIYIGDGMTDIPAMILAKNNGGKSIAVYPRGKKDKVQSLFEEGRVNYICPADYREGKELDLVMHLLLQSIAINEQLGAKESKETNND
ncbi:MAG: haloacid dehalogenase-like hydrolase [Bacilli bacterium]|nr:haloacid dehalogenase-like hydrolase [Bacilli bacterium]